MLKRIVLPNIMADEIFPGLFVGGTESCSKEERKKLGITFTICLVNRGEKHTTITNSLCLKVADELQQNLMIYFPGVCALIDQELDRGGKVLVHCWAGQSRSVTMVLAWLIHRGYTYGEAWERMLQNHPEATPNGSFRTQLREWEKMLSDKKAI